jgi:hypothetical protein
VRTSKSTEGEQRGHRRMKLGHVYVHAALSDPVLKAAYAREAQNRKIRTCDLMMSDYLQDPVLINVAAAKDNGLAGGCLLVLTGDDFKVTRVWIVVRNEAGLRLEEGFAVPAQGSIARVWVYTAQQNLAAVQTVVVEVTATDRASHSTTLTTTHPN